jgi:6-phosphofructokinase
LIPESPFYLDGEGGLLEYIEKRLKENKHMVIVVAEGAGQDLIAKSIATSDQQDASGNKLLLDIGLWLTHKIKVYNYITKIFFAAGFEPYLVILVFTVSGIAKELNDSTILCGS